MLNLESSVLHVLRGRLLFRMKPSMGHGHHWHDLAKRWSTTDDGWLAGFLSSCCFDGCLQWRRGGSKGCSIQTWVSFLKGEGTFIPGISFLVILNISSHSSSVTAIEGPWVTVFGTWRDVWFPKRGSFSLILVGGRNWKSSSSSSLESGNGRDRFFWGEAPKSWDFSLVFFGIF